jgi:phospholipid/cholesterol/gamma-HCH transport system ATP-binding protein
VRFLKGLICLYIKGEIITVIGKSGTGKFVLLKHIIDFMGKDSGRLLIEGEAHADISKEKRTDFEKGLSYMFQNNALFDFLNVYNYIALPLAENVGIVKDQIQKK